MPEQILPEDVCNHKWVRVLKDLHIRGGWLMVYRCTKCSILDHRHEGGTK